MPPPPTSLYNPQALGAKCSECPLKCSKGFLPVPPRYVKNPTALLIIESPDNESKYHQKPMQGKASKLLEEDLETFGLPSSQVTVLHRIACCPPISKRTDTLLRKAANACLPRVLRELERIPPKTPTLYLSKWGPIGLVPSGEFPSSVEIKLRRGVMRNNHMFLPHPRVPYFAKPLGKKIFLSQLSRFAQFATGRLVWPHWTNVITEPSEEALHALRTMGGIIAYDAETLGTDPLTVPITAIGISDGAQTVSLGWCSYENRHGSYTGIVDDESSLARVLQTEVKKVLESDREMVAHNGTYDILSMEGIGIRARVDWDTLDMYKIIYPECPANLEDVAAHLLLLPHRWKTAFRAGRDDDAKGASEFAESARENLLRYNSYDTLVTRWLYDPLVKLLKENP